MITSPEVKKSNNKQKEDRKGEKKKIKVKGKLMEDFKREIKRIQMNYLVSIKTHTHTHTQPVFKRRRWAFTDRRSRTAHLISFLPDQRALHL